MPDTTAGRALLAEYDDPEAPIYPPRESDIDAIEEQAKQQERERIRGRLRDLDDLDAIDDILAEPSE